MQRIAPFKCVFSVIVQTNKLETSLKSNFCSFFFISVTSITFFKKVSEKFFCSTYMCQPYHKKCLFILPHLLLMCCDCGNTSVGSGNIIVELFSADIDCKACK